MASGTFCIKSLKRAMPHQIFQYFRIPAWLQGFGDWNKRNHIEIEAGKNSFFCFRTLSLSKCHVNIFYFKIGHIRYINIILTWLWGFRDKLLYLVMFSEYPSLFWELRDQNFAISTRKLQNHVRILIHWTWPIDLLSLK